MRIINAKECAVVALGRLGENEYTVVRFDVSAWLSEYPEAVIGLYNQRPGDADAYPIAAIAVEDGVATWTVTSAELTKTGEGRCELVVIAGEVVAKSALFRTMVFDALDGSGEAPEPWEEWQQQFIILKGEAEQAADRAEEAAEHYPRITDGVWEVWDGTTEQWVSTGVQAQGPQGQQGPQGEPGPQGVPGQNGAPGADGTTFTPAVSAEGVISWTNNGGKTNPQPVNIKGPQGDDGTSPTVSVTDITGGHRVTVTDANGTRSFDVMDGDDYTLTAADKAEIAQQAAAEVDVPTVATTSQVKAGTDSEHFLAPSVQDSAVFYALAKAAGADMKNLSGETVGVYPEAQKIAIQKMLGIYEAPWELIREDAFTNAEEADHIITADANGEPLELTDCLLIFRIPSQDSDVKIGATGAKNFYYDSDNFDTLYNGSSNIAGGGNIQISFSKIMQYNGLIELSATNTYSGNSRVSFNVVTSASGPAAAYKIIAQRRIYRKIVIRAVTGTANYILYGKRKWQ